MMIILVINTIHWRFLENQALLPVISQSPKQTSQHGVIVSMSQMRKKGFGEVKTSQIINPVTYRPNGSYPPTAKSLGLSS